MAGVGGAGAELSELWASVQAKLHDDDGGGEALGLDAALSLWEATKARFRWQQRGAKVSFRVGPNCATWPSVLIYVEHPYQRPELDPRLGPTLCNLWCRSPRRR
jgi:hypothetical protein